MKMKEEKKETCKMILFLKEISFIFFDYHKNILKEKMCLDLAFIIQKKNKRISNKILINIVAYC